MEAVCIECGNTFSKKHVAKVMCNECVIKRYAKKYREKYKEYSKEYRENNKEKIKEYYQTNKEAINQKAKEYRESNKEAMKKREKEYNKKQSTKITDIYLCGLLSHRSGLTVSDIRQHPELIELKRAEIKLKRELNNL